MWWGQRRWRVLPGSSYGGQPAEEVWAFIRLVRSGTSQSGTEAHAAKTGPKTLRLITIINPGTPDTPRRSVLRCGKRERRIRRVAMVRRKEWQLSMWLEGSVGKPENTSHHTNVPYDGCAIVAGENATMAVASAILLTLSRPTDLSLSLCEIEIARTVG